MTHFRSEGQFIRQSIPLSAVVDRHYQCPVRRAVAIFFGDQGDSWRLAAYSVLLLISYLTAKRWPAQGVLLFFIGALGVVLSLILDPNSFVARLQFGLIVYGALAAPIILGMAVFLGRIGVVTGVILAWLSLIPQFVLIPNTSVQTVAFAAFQVALIGLGGHGVHLLLLQLETAKRALERTSLFDDLTEFGNRRALALEFSRCSSLAMRGGGRFLVSSWDVNGLKRINDSFGHAAGDAHLQGFARALRANARAEDVFFRIGGDEFIGLHLGLEDGEKLISRVRNDFPEVAAGWVMASQGLEASLHEADGMMYADKSGSRSLNDGTPESIITGLEVIVKIIKKDMVL